VPTAAYTLATLVALDRVNTRAHFASDVFAGAVLERSRVVFLVARHGERPHEVDFVEPSPHAQGKRILVDVRF